MKERKVFLRALILYNFRPLLDRHVPAAWLSFAVALPIGQVIRETREIDNDFEPVFRSDGKRALQWCYEFSLASSSEKTVRKIRHGSKQYLFYYLFYQQEARWNMNLKWRSRKHYISKLDHFSVPERYIHH